MRYEIIRSDGVSRVIIVEEDSFNTIPDLSIDLVGHKKKRYGETVATSFVRLLENFSSEYEPSSPIPGQLWYYKGNADCATDETKCPRLKLNMGTDDGSANANWVGLATMDDVGAHVLNDLDDVSLVVPYYDPISNTGHALMYDVHYQVWRNAPIPTPKLYLEELRNVSYGASLQDDQLLAYKNGTWTNLPLSSIERSLGDLSDVNIINPNVNNIIAFNGTTWNNRSLNELINLEDLKDVYMTSNKVSGQALVFDGSSWKNEFVSLENLSDVSITTTPQNGQALVYDAASSSWIPGTVSGGGGGGISTLNDTSSNTGISIIENGIPNSSGEVFLRKIEGGNAINVSENDGNVVINYTGGTGGGVAGAANYSSAGIGVYGETLAGILQFRPITSSDGSISVTPYGDSINLTVAGGSTTANLGDLNNVTDNDSSQYNLMYGNSGASGTDWVTGPYKLEYLSNVSDIVTDEPSILVRNNNTWETNQTNIYSRTFAINDAGSGLLDQDVTPGTFTKIIDFPGANDIFMAKTANTKVAIICLSATLLFNTKYTGSTPSGLTMRIDIYAYEGGSPINNTYPLTLYNICPVKQIDNLGNVFWGYPPLTINHTIVKSNISASDTSLNVDYYINITRDRNEDVNLSVTGVLIDVTVGEPGRM